MSAGPNEPELPVKADSRPDDLAEGDLDQAADESLPDTEPH